MSESIRRFVRVSAILLAALFCLGSAFGCSASRTDFTVAKVGDVDITYQAYSQAYQQYYMYSYYGYLTDIKYDVSTAESKRAWEDYIFTMLINSAVPTAIAHREGVKLTAEEESKLDEDMEAQIQESINSYKESVDASITDEAAIAAECERLFKQAVSDNGMTYDQYTKKLREALYDDAIANKVLDEVYATAAISDEEVRAEYDRLLAEQQTKYAEDPAAYYTDYSAFQSGSAAVAPIVVPDGFYYVKHIYIKNDDEDGDDSTVRDVDAIVKEINGKLESNDVVTGEIFDALIEEYNEDPGMAEEAYKEGYLMAESISDKYYAEFSAMALTLKTEGEIGYAESDGGVHIIRRYGDVPASTTSFEDAQASIRTSLETVAKNDAITAALAQWKEELNIKIYYDRVQYYTLGN